MLYMRIKMRRLWGKYQIVEKEPTMDVNCKLSETETKQLYCKKKEQDAFDIKTVISHVEWWPNARIRKIQAIKKL